MEVGWLLIFFVVATLANWSDGKKTRKTLKPTSGYLKCPNNVSLKGKQKLIFFVSEKVTSEDCWFDCEEYFEKVVEMDYLNLTNGRYRFDYYGFDNRATHRIVSVTYKCNEKDGCYKLTFIDETGRLDHYNITLHGGQRLKYSNLKRTQCSHEKYDPNKNEYIWKRDKKHSKN
ncbi:unnamed protein product [Bursaphelenchus okinawaensis]|uniref:Uncharacterized protein n=1 Tax=Bursaphelenchus okinawaensis TaxID=465554 RepID=A0A811JRS8_9BILA|nr:unnamed protein product [Bursaphelenchus okinawaensis]CAG9080248.1 unnamed protein product [Bursaphelenchus okinawaensis]